MPVIESTKAQSSAIPAIVDELCRACHRCVARQVCRTKAILQIDAGDPPFIDAGLCYGCHACIPACPYGAIAVNGRQPEARSDR